MEIITFQTIEDFKMERIEPGFCQMIRENVNESFQLADQAIEASKKNPAAYLQLHEILSLNHELIDYLLTKLEEYDKTYEDFK